MKKLNLIVIFVFLFLLVFSLNSFSEVSHRAEEIKPGTFGGNFVADNFTFPDSISVTNVVSSSSVCIGVDCRSSWPSDSSNSGWQDLGSSVVLISSTDRVGIGTTNPSGLLHVSSGDSGDAIVIIESDEDNNDEFDNPRLVFSHDGKEGNFTIGFMDGFNLGNTFGFYLNDTIKDFVALSVDTTKKFVGIGTVVPNATLDINGTSRIGGSFFGWSNTRLSSSPDAYYKIAVLPASSSSTYDSLLLEGVFDDNWLSYQKAPFRIFLSNRGGFNFLYDLYGDRKLHSHIKAYEEDDGSVSVYAVFDNGYYTSMVLNVVGSIDVQLFPDPVINSSPVSGTLIFDSAVNSSRFTVTNSGNLYVNGNIVPSVNDTYSLGSPDLMWKDIYVSSGTIYLGGKPLSLDDSGNLLFDGNQVETNVTSPSLWTNSSGNATFVNGNVGIGTVSPGYALEVVGNVLISNSSILSGGFRNPDYGYLSELGGFIGGFDEYTAPLSLYGAYNILSLLNKRGGKVSFSENPSGGNVDYLFDGAHSRVLWSPVPSYPLTIDVDWSNIYSDLDYSRLFWMTFVDKFGFKDFAIEFYNSYNSSWVLFDNVSGWNKTFYARYFNGSNFYNVSKLRITVYSGQNDSYLYLSEIGLFNNAFFSSRIVDAYGHYLKMPFPQYVSSYGSTIYGSLSFNTSDKSPLKVNTTNDYNYIELGGGAKYLGLQVFNGDSSSSYLIWNNGTRKWTFYAGGGGLADIKMVVGEDGNVGIGYTSPSYKLDVDGNGHFSGTVTQDSDIRLKDNISYFDSKVILNNLVNLDGFSYNFDYYKRDLLRAYNILLSSDNFSVKRKIDFFKSKGLVVNDSFVSWNILESLIDDKDVYEFLKSKGFSFSDKNFSKRMVGFSAQQVKEYFPDVVSVDSSTNTYALSYSSMVPYLVEAIKELKEEVDVLKQQVNSDTVVVSNGSYKNIVFENNCSIVKTNTGLSIKC